MIGQAYTKISYIGRSLPAVLLLFLLGMAVVGCGSSAESDCRPVDQIVELQASVARGSSPTPEPPARPGFPDPLPSPPVTLYVPILMYHHVGEPPPEADELWRGLTISRPEFEAQMLWLKDAGYETVTQAQLFNALYYGGPLPPKPVMLTFDDGYMDSYTEALPVLQGHGFTATFYVLAGKVGANMYMGWGELADLDRMGMDIGSHSMYHLDLTKMPPQEAQHELFESSAVLGEHLGHPVYWLCYPSGEYNDETMRFAGEAGYLLAVTVDRGRMHVSTAPHRLPRYRVKASGLDKFADMLEGTDG